MGLSLWEEVEEREKKMVNSTEYHKRGGTDEKM